MEAGNTRSTAKRIAIFNHKGGVGKTTLTVNVATQLSKLGKRVLLIDSDPQCNLTAYLLAEEVVDDLLDNSDSDKGRTIWTALKPVSEGLGNFGVVEPIEMPDGRLFILPGDIRLSEFEAELGGFLGDCVQRKPKGFRGASALSLLINELALKHQIDFVFYDAGPNIGPLNQVILLDCDYFIVSLGCDLFSIRALKTLGRTLARWVKEWKTISDLAPAGNYLLPGKPKPIGYIIQRFRTYRGVVASEPAKYLVEIEKRMREDIVAVLSEADFELIRPTSGSSIGEVKDFGGKASGSQATGRTLGEIDPEAADVFSNIAKNILARTQ